MSIECKHGYLARACDRCEMEQEIERLRAFVRAWDAWRNQPDDLCTMLLFVEVDAAREAVGPLGG